MRVYPIWRRKESIERPLAQLLYYFNWKLPNEMKPGNLDMDETTFGATTLHYTNTTKRKNNLFLVATSHGPIMPRLKPAYAGI